MALRGIRGAITVKKNTRKDIIEATEELLITIVKENKIKVADIATVFFSTTKDLNVVFPAKAARNLGWLYTPLLCTNEIYVQHALKKCVRVLLHVNSAKPQKAMRHIYLKGAKKLRPDLKNKSKYYFS